MLAPVCKRAQVTICDEAMAKSNHWMHDVGFGIAGRTAAKPLKVACRIDTKQETFTEKHTTGTRRQDLTCSKDTQPPHDLRFRGYVSAISLY